MVRLPKIKMSGSPWYMAYALTRGASIEFDDRCPLGGSSFFRHRVPRLKQTLAIMAGLTLLGSDALRKPALSN